MCFHDVMLGNDVLTDVNVDDMCYIVVSDLF